MGRPKVGALSTYPSKLIDQIKSIRRLHPKWGAITILMELELDYNYTKSELPSEASIYRFFEEEGLIIKKSPRVSLPTTSCNSAKEVHEIWEMDAEGALFILGIDYQSSINIKDSLSRKYCMTFPVKVKNYNTQPRKIHYQWALRLAFIESGLPKTIQVDKDSVFIENSSRSPFPSRFHLWILGLKIELCFIDRPPPVQNAMIERSHQTMLSQITQSVPYENWQSLFKTCNKRRNRLNKNYPSRTFNKQAPLEAYPQAIHSQRNYSVRGEMKQFDMDNVYTFLAKGKWYRKVSSSKGIQIGGQRYHVKGATPKMTVTITFCKKSKQLIFRDFNELIIAQQPIKNCSKQDLIGANTNDLLLMKKKIFHSKDFPLE